MSSARNWQALEMWQLNIDYPSMGLDRVRTKGICCSGIKLSFTFPSCINPEYAATWPADPNVDADKRQMKTKIWSN
jgi:hypothetical protein